MRDTVGLVGEEKHGGKRIIGDQCLVSVNQCLVEELDVSLCWGWTR